MKIWLTLCFTKPVMKRALWTALIVGTILILINHGNTILKGEVDLTRVFQMCLTFIVPYIVSTVSSVSTLLSLERGLKIYEDSSKAD
ncbi:MAG TPA: nitrate/nitrite transporter NrtS [Anaerolineales bacterium]|nr:nitrate/nitrite transporter NrtS [Anaerolineales bacterium]